MKSTSTTLTRGLPRKQRPKDRVLLRLEHIKKTFLVGKRRVEVLKGIDLDIHEGEMAIIYGPSGCGKSTMLHTMLGLEEPDAGKVYLDDKFLYYLNDLIGIQFLLVNNFQIKKRPISFIKFKTKRI